MHIFTSCQKDLSVDTTDSATGSLLKDVNGDCAPITVNGNYKINTLLTNVNYIEIQANFSTIGNYDITSDTINNFSFYGNGVVAILGITTLRLYASGTPINIGTNVFTIKFGTNTCEVNISVTNTTNAIFTIIGAPVTCNTPLIGGTYTVGTSLLASNTVTVQVDVSNLGVYSISTNIVNGMSFNKIGTFSNLGVQSIILTGSGIPTSASTNTFQLNGPTGCTFNIVVLPTSTSHDVYVAGNDYIGQGTTLGPIATVWKNGVRTALTDGSTEAYANSIYVVGNDVYVAGQEGGYPKVAKVWKNGTPISITNGFNDAEANSIFVAGTDIYVAGSEYIGSNFVAKLWKNGVSSSLSNNTLFGRANSVYVVGTDVYVVGERGNTYPYTATLWKNGTSISLTDGTKDAGASSVFVVNSDVYVAGSEYNGTRYVAKLWKNGIATSLTDGTKDAGANSVFVQNSNVYVGGGEQSSIGSGFNARVWKNGALTNLSNGSEPASSIFILGSDIYVAGSNYVSGQGNTATVWKNSVASQLPHNSIIQSVARSVFVK